jgi:carbamoyltransferase
MNILGVSALYHDSAACLVRDGDIVAAAQEERFTRKKHDAGIPYNAISYCVEEGRLGPHDLDIVVFYDKPLTKFTRLLSTYGQIAPRGLRQFLAAAPVWLRDKIWGPCKIEAHLKRCGLHRPRRFLFAEHHHSHAASAFYPSPFPEAAIITVDGVGEWATTALGVGAGNHLELLFEQHFPHSLGLLYSAFTYFTGFKVNSGEYKLMGLAPYGRPRYVDVIKDKLVRIKEDGSFRLNLKYFGYLDSLTMTNRAFNELFGGPPRRPESDITEREMDLASSIQTVTEEILLKMARYARAVTGKDYLCLAGGVALNCVANGKLLRSGLFKDLWIQPAAGDAGGALGAALYVWYRVLGNPRQADGSHDFMKQAFLGPAFSPERIKTFLDSHGLPYRQMATAERDTFIARALRDGKVVGLLQGRMEFGPRALCNRSILGDATNTKMQSCMNLAIKFRESFRPFAPAVMEEEAMDYFETGHKSPYMLLVDLVQPQRRLANAAQHPPTLREWVNTPRSDIPAITHVDYSARLQTVSQADNPRMYNILREFKKLAGYSVVVNTSFNVRGEPIVCTPEDAYRCFMRTGMDVLVLEDCVLRKAEQPPWHETVNWRQEFVLD